MGGGAWESDIPVPGDYDGDGVTDIAIWRPSDGKWYVLTSGSNFSDSFSRSWGEAEGEDVPLVGLLYHRW